MNATHLRFQIDQLRQDKIIYGVGSIAVFILAFFVAVFLPQLMYQFYYVNQTLTAEPPEMKYIPVATFVIAIGYFLFSAWQVMMKKAKIMRLEKELEMTVMDEDMPRVRSMPASTTSMSEAMSSIARKSSKVKSATKKSAKK